MEMIEHVARALCRHAIHTRRTPAELKATGEAGIQRSVDYAWEHFATEARVAVEAMRGMAPVVREAGEVVHELRGPPAAIWATMLDAAVGQSARKD